eukprot:2982663-Amphidinium_carterae.2
MSVLCWSCLSYVFCMARLKSLDRVLGWLSPKDNRDGCCHLYLTSYGACKEAFERMGETPYDERGHAFLVRAEHVPRRGKRDGQSSPGQIRPGPVIRLGLGRPG